MVYNTAFEESLLVIREDVTTKRALVFSRIMHQQAKAGKEGDHSDGRDGMPKWHLERASSPSCNSAWLVQKR